MLKLITWGNVIFLPPQTKSKTRIETREKSWVSAKQKKIKNPLLSHKKLIPPNSYFGLSITLFYTSMYYVLHIFTSWNVSTFVVIFSPNRRNKECQCCSRLLMSTFPTSIYIIKGSSSSFSCVLCVWQLEFSGSLSLEWKGQQPLADLFINKKPLSPTSFPDTAQMYNSSNAASARLFISQRENEGG